MPAVFRHLTKLLLVIVFFALSFTTFAHTVDEDTKQFLLQSSGIQIIPFLYIGADHMVTGYDHLLFLVGVIFFLFKTKDILLYVSLFTLGHSVTLLFGVLNNIQVNAYLIDAIIGFSVIYKGFDNLGGFQKVFNFTPNNKIAVLIFFARGTLNRPLYFFGITGVGIALCRFNCISASKTCISAVA